MQNLSSKIDRMFQTERARKTTTLNIDFEKMAKEKLSKSI